MLFSDFRKDAYFQNELLELPYRAVTQISLLS